MNKILIIDNSPGITGAFNSIYQVATKLRSNFKFIFLVPKGSINSKKLAKSDFIVRQVSFLEISKSFKTILYFPVLIYNAIRISIYIKKHNIEIVHVNDLYNMTGIIIKILRPKIKLVYHIRLLPNSYAGTLYPIWSNLIERFADSIICVSEKVAQNFSSTAVIIYDALPLTPVHNRVVSNSYPIRFICMANYTRGKGHEYVLRAFQKSTIELPSVILDLFGSTFNREKNVFYKEELIELAKGLKIEHLVKFNGFTDNPVKEISKSDIALNFSDSESFSMTTLEGLSCGIPTIATDCGGPSEIIENGISGILVPPGDINVMSKEMIRLAKDSGLRELLSKNGIERVKIKFIFDNQASRLSTLYTRLLKLPYGH